MAFKPWVAKICAFKTLGNIQQGMGINLIITHSHDFLAAAASFVSLCTVSLCFT